MFADAVVETIVFVLRKGSKRDNDVRIVNCDNRLLTYQEKQIGQKTFQKTHANAISINITEGSVKLKTKLDKGNVSLGYLVNINQAIALKYDRSQSLFRSAKGANYKKVIDGRNIDRYSLVWDGWFLAYDVKKIHSCKRTDIFDAEEKLFFRRVGDRLIATLDHEQYYALNTLVVITSKTPERVSLKYVLALINSYLLNYYYVTYLKSTKKVFSEIQARQLSKIPMLVPNMEDQTEKHRHDKIVTYVELLLELNRKYRTTKEKMRQEQLSQEISITDEKLNRLIFDIYGLTDSEIEMIHQNG